MWFYGVKFILWLLAEALYMIRKLKNVSWNNKKEGQEYYGAKIISMISIPNILFMYT